jgi:hypothetical protein
LDANVNQAALHFPGKVRRKEGGIVSMFLEIESVLTMPLCPHPIPPSSFKSLNIFYILFFSLTVLEKCAF